MSRRTFACCFGAFVVLQAAWTLATQVEKPPGPLRTERIAEDLYLIAGEGGNIAFAVTSEGVVLVDNMFHRNHADILTQIGSVTDRPLRYVFNTHQHDDHAGGNTRMLPLAEVIAHRNVRANLSDIRQPYYEDTPGTPIGCGRGRTAYNPDSVNLDGERRCEEEAPNTSYPPIATPRPSTAACSVG